MDKYLEAELRLAAELGWNIKRVGDVATGWLDQDGKYKSDLPRWCGDWSACGPLIGEHQLKVTVGDSWVGVGLAMAANWPLSFARFADHPDRDTAVMFAVVQGVIAKLSTQQEG